MKSEKKSIEGQMDIFEAMNRAAEAVDRMVEQEHRTKKSKEIETQSIDSKRKEEVKHMKGDVLHASMQRTFINTSDDDFATVAYIDYNMIYWRDWNAPASLRCFQTAKEAVDFYVEKLNELRENVFASPAMEHEPFCNLVQVADDFYSEEG